MPSLREPCTLLASCRPKSPKAELTVAIAGGIGGTGGGVYVGGGTQAAVGGIPELLTGGVVFIMMLTVALPAPAAFLAVTTTLDEPAVVGVPEIKPLEALTLNPSGSTVAPKLVGLFVALIL